MITGTVRDLNARLDDIRADGGLEVIVVDDGSRDATAALAADAGAELDRR
jgi:glycosyltransferase involved in cell wall biosynthesis